MPFNGRINHRKEKNILLPRKNLSTVKTYQRNNFFFFFSRSEVPNAIHQTTRVELSVIFHLPATDTISIRKIKEQDIFFFFYFSSFFFLWAPRRTFFIINSSMMWQLESATLWDKGRGGGGGKREKLSRIWAWASRRRVHKNFFIVLSIK